MDDACTTPVGALLRRRVERSNIPQPSRGDAKAGVSITGGQGATFVETAERSLPAGVGEGGRNVASGVQDAPDVDVSVVVDVEDEVGEARHWPGAKVGDAELVGEAQGPVVWVPSEVRDRPFDGSDESRRDRRPGLAQVVGECIVDVIGGPAAQLDRLGHDAQSLPRMRLRSSAK
jgi:hypothetical protein